jgi:DNA-binding IclR family transcriptional regulator
MAGSESLARARDLLELVSRVVESNPGASAPAIRVRAGVTRASGDKALELLTRSGFIERRTHNGQDAFYSVKPYRVSTEAPRAGFADTHATRQGGGG